MKIDIKSRFFKNILFSHDCLNNRIKITTERAVQLDTDLWGADLRRANLRRANLGKANLGHADLGGSDLRKANLKEANLGRADTKRANFGGANLMGANLGETNFEGADLRDTDLRGANLWGANFGGANLRGANLWGTHLGDADLRRADLTGADIRETYLGNKKTSIKEIMQIGPVGSRGDYTIAFRCTSSIEISCGCRWLDLDGFEETVLEEHGSNIYGKQYIAMIHFLRDLWK
jgi:uncharacterized protein YjbI with pentapeptide repeats